MTANRDQPTTPKGPTVPHERCAGCDATLVEDQRYCLQCGTRRGRPRIDFTAFWGPLSPTGAAHEQPAAGTATGRGREPADGQVGGWTRRFPSIAGAPSRRVVGALAASVLAVGILAGAALGPGPASSPADSSTLAQQALAGLLARADSGSRVSTTTTTPAPATAPPVSEATPTPVPASGTDHKAKSTSRAGSSEASGPGEGSSSSEPSTSGTSEGSSSEGSSKSSKGSGAGEKAAPGTPIKLPPIKHVWLISLSGESFSGALAQPRTDPYLAKQLVPEGTLLSDYALTASSELANGIALLSGQGVNLDTEKNCPTYTEVQPPTISATSGLIEGVGCVYPAEVKTLPDELTAADLTWKAYVQSMEAGASTTSTGSTSPAAPASAATVTCRHPEPGATDLNQAPSPGDPYITAENPFVYFDSLLDGGACASDDVELGQLQSDLATPASTPNLSWIVPSACDDGSSTPCAPGAPAGLAAADAFLKEVVPPILATNAYRKEGLIAIVPDSPPSPSASDATKPVGALLISPFVRGGARVSESIGDFSLLKSLARLFGVLPLGHANDPSTVSFGATVYGASGKAASAASAAKKAAQAASTTQPRRQSISDPVDRGSVASHPGG
jgi:hypothetical protein